MKLQCVSLWLLGTILILCSVDNHGLRRCLISTDMHHIEESFQEIKRAIQAKDTFPNVTILSTLETLQIIKPLDVCCVTKNLLAFYVDRVFKDHQEPNPKILRKISSIANSFLYMQKTLRQCVSHWVRIPASAPCLPKERPGSAGPHRPPDMVLGVKGNSLRTSTGRTVENLSQWPLLPQGSLPADNSSDGLLLDNPPGVTNLCQHIP
ncbi:interleukin-19 isoform X1 [Homo sapiens]|uniref:Isoform 3 of Interleukin-19 n=1 Tax=Homo sapiens TaxID=9606 RepID=Q9UHD0-3|nr:interleukin-19 isoform X1 [Homo sapiens]XP_054192173.1 interleukin-19 isoform X1 [Homo sapiens]ACJ06540.1 interleukin 19 isoform 3 precursor [Homo sapiens]|eukprot:XP_011507752.1 interleukin-19 isoform X1 [Homo sapiens]